MCPYMCQCTHRALVRLPQNSKREQRDCGSEVKILQMWSCNLWNGRVTVLQRTMFIVWDSEHLLTVWLKTARVTHNLWPTYKKNIHILQTILHTPIQTHTHTFFYVHSPIQHRHPPSSWQIKPVPEQTPSCVCACVSVRVCTCVRTYEVVTTSISSLSH